MITFNQNTPPALQSAQFVLKSSQGVRVGQFSHPFFPLIQQDQSAPPMPQQAPVSAPPINEVETPYDWTHSSMYQKSSSPVIARKSALSRSGSEKRQWPWSALTKMTKSSPVLYTAELNTRREQMRKKTLPAFSVAHSQKKKLTKSKSAPILKPRTRAHCAPMRNQKPLPALPLAAPLKQTASSTFDDIESPYKAALDDKPMYFTCDFGIDGDVFFVPISPTSIDR